MASLGCADHVRVLDFRLWRSQADSSVKRGLTMRFIFVFLLGVGTCASASNYRCVRPDGSNFVQEANCPKGTREVRIVKRKPTDQEVQQRQREAEREALWEVCRNKGYRGVEALSSCVTNQQLDRSWLESLRSHPTDGRHVDGCLRRWRVPGTATPDYSQARACVNVKVARSN